MNKLLICIPHSLYNIEIQSDEFMLLKILKNIYFPYISELEENCKIKIFVCYQENCITIISYYKRYKKKILNLYKKNGVRQICRIIQRLLLTEKNWNFLHGAAIEYNNKTHVFLGQSMIGKTTLILYLSENDKISYLAEDILIVDYINGYILPYQRPLQIRQETIDFLYDRYSIKLNNYKKFELEDYKRVSYEIQNSKLISLKKIDKIYLLKRDNLNKNINNENEIFLEQCFLPMNIKQNIICSEILADKYKLKILDCTDLSDIINHID